MEKVLHIRTASQPLWMNNQVRQNKRSRVKNALFDRCALMF